MGVRRLSVGRQAQAWNPWALYYNPDFITNISFGSLICNIRWQDKVIEKGFFWHSSKKKTAEGPAKKMNAVQAATQTLESSPHLAVQGSLKLSPYFSFLPHRPLGPSLDRSESTRLKEPEERNLLVDREDTVQGPVESETNPRERSHRQHRLPTSTLPARPDMLNHRLNHPVGYSSQVPWPRTALRKAWEEAPPNPPAADLFFNPA